MKTTLVSLSILAAALAGSLAVGSASAADRPAKAPTTKTAVVPGSLKLDCTGTTVSSDSGGLSCF